MTRETKALVDELNSCVREEIASITSLDEAIAAEKDPGFVVLFQEVRSEKQAAVEQLATLTRMLGRSPAESGFLQGGRAKKIEVQSLSVSRSLELEALRAAEDSLIEAYRKLRDELPEGFEKRVVTKVLERAVKRWHILTAHLARASGDKDEARSLPRPLGEYFASAEDRVCMRCLFDRPGARKALVRSSPNPKTYVCAACHDEVLAEFPPELRPQVEASPEDRREVLVIEKALGRPEVLRASNTAIALLSGLQPDVPPATKEPIVERREKRQWAAETEDAAVEIPRVGSKAEVDYIQALFDFRTLSRFW
jgi:hypothetical protein